MVMRKGADFARIANEHKISMILARLIRNRNVQTDEDIEKFLTTQQPFINACLSTVNNEGLSYTDFVHAPVGSNFDVALDEEPTGLKVDNGTPITFVLKLGYFFPESSIAVHPVKAIVLV